MNLEVLYEDSHVIVVNKPAGVLVQGDKSGDPNLMDFVKTYLKEKYQKPGNVFLGLVHRLDRPVSGLVLFAKTSKGASRLSEQFRNRTIQKSYQAIVEGKINPTLGSLTHRLSKDSDERKSHITDDGEIAEMSYNTLKSNDLCSLLIIDLHTGRFHQIRAQLAHIGHPIYGDTKYGSRTKLPEGNIALCATSLTFQTATTNETKTLGIPYPHEWNTLIS